MKFILYLILAVLFTVTPCLAQDDSDKWVTVRKSQLMEWRDHLLALQSTVGIYSARITVLELDIMRLENNFKALEERYNRARKGFWVGAAGSFPLGVQGMTMYQFNERFGLFTMGGYSGSWSISAGFIARIK